MVRGRQDKVKFAGNCRFCQCWHRLNHQETKFNHFQGKRIDLDLFIMIELHFEQLDNRLCLK